MERIVNLSYVNDEGQTVFVRYIVDDESLSDILDILQDCEVVD